jgi:hypothetical protein
VGFELGAAAMAAIIAVGPLVLALGAFLAITWPEVRVLPTMAVFLVAGLVLPIVLYPMSYTMWQAVDLMMRPVEPQHFDLDHLDLLDLGPLDPDPLDPDPPDPDPPDADA